MSFQTKLIKIDLIANETYSFHLEKPDGFAFVAGQFVDFKIVVGGIEQGHYLSICSAPHEDEIILATRNTGSPFKKAMLALTPESAITLDGPMGQFTLDKNFTGQAVFITGGIGITPIRSMLREAEETHFMNRKVLFYSNRTTGDAPFFNEFQNITHPSFTLINVMTDDTNWSGEKGYFTAELFTRHLPQPQTCKYYVVGPPGLVAGALEILKQLNIPESQIVTEQFIGY